MPPLRETIADSISGGQLTEARAAVQKIGEQFSTIYSEARRLTREIEDLKTGGTLAEGYADQSWNGRLARDAHWQQLSGYAQHRVIQKGDVDLYHDLMSYAYQFCPLIKAAVDIKTGYTFGLSFNIESEVAANNTLIQDITNDLRNRHALFGAQAIAEADRELQKGGNIYLAMWIKQKIVQIRLWTSYEITDILFGPEDADIPLYYVRSWTDAKGLQTAAYPSIFNTAPAGIIQYNGNTYTVDKTVVVYQMSEGRAVKQKWALSPYTSALHWNRAYEQFLLDFAAIVQIIRKYTTMFTTTGGNAQVTALQTAFANEQRGPHKEEVGNGLVATEGNDFKVIDAGSNKIVGPQDSRYLLLQVCTSTRVPENMLTGNLQTGNRASAQEMTANFLPIIEERQTMWTETFTEVFGFILGNPDFSVSFPPIRAQDSLTYLQTLVQAATLGQPGKLAGTMRPEDIIRAVYEALDVPVPDNATVEEMVQGIRDSIATDPAATAALDNLTQATNRMNSTVAEMMKKPARREEFNPDQPRDDDGKWSDTGGGGSSGSSSGGGDNSGGSGSGGRASLAAGTHEWTSAKGNKHKLSISDDGSEADLTINGEKHILPLSGTPVIGKDGAIHGVTDSKGDKFAITPPPEIAAKINADNARKVTKDEYHVQKGIVALKTTPDLRNELERASGQKIPKNSGVGLSIPQVYTVGSDGSLQRLGGITAAHVTKGLSNYEQRFDKIVSTGSTPGIYTWNGKDRRI